MNNYNYYHEFAKMFLYPEEHMETYTALFLNMVAAEFPEKHSELQQLISLHNKLTAKGQQEYYLKTFDVQAVCYLDIGYVMFGDDYKRAQLLVNLQTEHQKAGVDCGHELGDHLPNVLKLLASTEDRDFANELGFIILTPAIRFMILKFGEVENFYKSLLQFLLEMLTRDFDGKEMMEYSFPEETFDPKKDFIISSPKSVLCETVCNTRKKI